MSGVGVPQQDRAIRPAVEVHVGAADARHKFHATITSCKVKSRIDPYTFLLAFILQKSGQKNNRRRCIKSPPPPHTNGK